MTDDALTARSSLASCLPVLVVALLSGLLGCNMVTGADGLIIGEDDDTAATAGAGGSDNTSSGQGAAGQGGAGPGGNTTAGVGAGGPIEDAGPVDGVSIDAVVLYQSVARPLMANGAPVSSSTPVVANREGLLRVFYTVDGAYNGQPVVGRLLVDGFDPIQVQVTPSGSSRDDDLDSTVNFDVPPNALGVGSSYRVELVQARELTSGENFAATYPTSPGAYDPTGARQAGTLTVTLVPVQYNADGSGRLPDTSASQLARYADLFYAMYPITDIDIQVRSQPLAWGSAVSSNGNGWSSLLDAVADLRNSDNAPFNDYYYGIFSPASSAQNYCGGGCVAGLGFLGGPADAWSHSAIGLGFSGDMAAETAVHELGHNHGREHAPCGGVSGADGSYPYSGAKIGSWGYNLLTGQLYEPNGHVDMMSYCSPAWISDYNFENIFDRIQTVNNAADVYTPPALAHRTYGRARVEPDGSLTWLSDITLERPPLGEATPITVDTQGGPEMTTASFIRYDHLDGGVLFIPPTQRALVAGGGVYTMIDGQELQAVIP